MTNDERKQQEEEKKKEKERKRLEKEEEKEKKKDETRVKNRTKGIKQFKVYLHNYVTCLILQGLA